AALKALCPVSCRRTEGSACRPRESPRIRISGLCASLAIRSSLTERSVGSGDAAPALAIRSPSATRGRSAFGERAILNSELEVDEGVGLADGHDREGGAGADGEALPEAGLEFDLPGVGGEVGEEDEEGERESELDGEKRVELGVSVEAVEADHGAEDV